MTNSGSLIIAGAIVVAVGGLFFASSHQQAAQQELYVNASNLQRALSDVAAVRQAMTMYYQERGKFPRDNKGLGIGAPESFKRYPIERLEILENGHIHTQLSTRLGPNAAMLHHPTASQTGIGQPVNWSCQSTSVGKELRVLLPHCEPVAHIKLPPRSLAPQELSSDEALHLAIKKRRVGQVREILRNKIELNQEHKGEVPLMVALTMPNNDAVAKALVRGGADPDYRNREGVTLLMRLVARPASVRQVRTLIGLGADVEARDRRGRTVLMHAANAGRHRVVDALLKAGAKIDAKDHAGMSAVKYASVRGPGNATLRRLNEEVRRNNEFVVRLPERPKMRM
ncbi:MAG: ankyrin repeat domain-containing protein [Gammaproteobacteria bacterium]|nr:ankyrin repeat domain-containing protein [Gammaproteobacteria bacterium]